MGNSISVTTDETKADPYMEVCSLIPLITNKEDVSLLYVLPPQKQSLQTTQLHTTSDSNFYGGSYEFDGTDDHLTSSSCGGCHSIHYGVLV